MNANTIDIFNRIKGEIYLGNASAAKNLPLLNTHSITHVLICCSEIGPSFAEKLTYKKLNIQETFDFNISSFFNEAYDFIESCLNSGGAILIHCVQGQSRSPTILISFLMKRFRLNLSKALQLVKKNHPQTEPNLGFIEQLQTYEKTLSESITTTTCSTCKCQIQ